MGKLYKTIAKNRIYIVIIILTIPAILPLLKTSFYHFSDEPHIADLYQMIRAIGSGQIPPRWAPDMSYGFGYPLFNFYYPMPFYLGALFFKLTGSLITSLKLLFLLSVPLSAMFMYKWLRLHTQRLPSIIGVVIYTYTPYRAVNLYVRGALGELFSFIFFPLVAYLTYRVLEKGKFRDIGYLSVAISLFILSHNLAPLFFLPWAAAYGLLLALSKFDMKKLAKVICAYFLGFLSSSYFWLPALIEKSNLASETPFYYMDHFPFIKQLIIPSWGYGSSVWGPTDEISLQIGVANLALIILVAVLFVTKKISKRKRVPLLYFLASLAIFLFLMNIRSSFLWELSSLANYIQFPWRLLMATTFLTSSLVIFVKFKRLVWKVILLVLGILSIVSTIGYFVPSEYFNPDDNYYLIKSFANRTSEGESDKLSEEYINYSEDYLLLPLWVEKRPSSLPESKITSKNLVVENVQELNAVHFESIIKGENEGLVSINNYYYPGWEVRIDDKIVDADIESPHGNMVVSVPSGEHTLEVQWKETPLRRMANTISVLALIGTLIFIFAGKRKSVQ